MARFVSRLIDNEIELWLLNDSDKKVEIKFKYKIICDFNGGEKRIREGQIILSPGEERQLETNISNSCELEAHIISEKEVYG